MTPVVIDATVLSNFAHVLKPKLLEAAFQTPVTVEAVMREIQIGMDSGRIPSVDWSWMPLEELTAEELASANVFNQTLGRGESQCIALALSRKWIVLTDDSYARRVAQGYGVRISGTLGILSNLVEQETLSLPEADEALRLMTVHGYRSPVRSLRTSQFTGWRLSKSGKFPASAEIFSDLVQ